MMKVSALLFPLLLSGASALKDNTNFQSKAKFMAAMEEATNKYDLADTSNKKSRPSYRIPLPQRRLDEDEVAETTKPTISPTGSPTTSPTKSSGAFGSDDEYDHSELFFDMTKYSLKVHSCASFTGYDLTAYGEEKSGDGGEEEGELTNRTSTYVSYRLCPTESCQDDGWNGCRNVYGNYMVPLESYLEAVLEGEDQEDEEKLEEYCGYCGQCMYIYKYMGATCSYYDACDGYASVCNEGAEGEGEEEEEEREEEIMYKEFAECTAVEIYVPEGDDDGNGRRKLEEGMDQVFLQIYCDGGSTLKIGMYSDEDCTSYIGDQYDMSELTGLNITESDLEDDILSTDCISCKPAVSNYYLPENKSGDGEEEEGNSRDEENEATELCRRTYEESIKCNEYIPFNYTAYYDDEGMLDEWNETMSSTTCAYIEEYQRNAVVSSNSYSISFSGYLSSSQGKAYGGGQSMYVFGGALAAVGAAIVVVRNRDSKSIGDNLNSAFVSMDDVVKG